LNKKGARPFALATDLAPQLGLALLSDYDQESKTLNLRFVEIDDQISSNLFLSRNSPFN